VDGESAPCPWSLLFFPGNSPAFPGVNPDFVGFCINTYTVYWLRKSENSVLKGVRKRGPFTNEKERTFADDGTVRELSDNVGETFGSDYHTITCTGEHVPYVPFPFRLIGNVRSLYFPVPEFVEGGVRGKKDP